MGSLHTAEHLLQVMDIEKSILKQVESVRQMWTDQLNGTGDLPTELVAHVVSKITSLIEGRLAWPIQKERYILAYAAAFSDEELVGMTEFFSSPAGQAYMNKSAELQSMGMELGQSIIGEIEPQIHQILDEAFDKADEAQERDRRILHV